MITRAEFDRPQLFISCHTYVLFCLGSGLMEDQKQPMEPEESVGEEDIPTEEADLPQEKQEEVSLSPTQNKEEKATEEIQADLEVNWASVWE